MEPKSMPPPPYPGQETGPSNIHVIQGPVTITTTMILGPDPMQMQCRHCHETMITRVEPVAGNMTWIFCGALMIFGCWLGCCLIPFCIPSMQDMEHWCSRCGRLLGIYQRRL